MTAIITLLTDFGQRDSYVAEMKAVLLSAVPDAQIVDVTHEVPPGDITAAQYLLARTWHRFPDGTVHLAVVDPGVGSARRAIAAASQEHRFVAPDNGLLTPMLTGARVVQLPVPATAALTFQGRDVFAPAAARLAAGTAIEQLGASLRDPILAPLPLARRDGTDLIGCVLYVDRFGNLVTNLEGKAAEWAGKAAKSVKKGADKADKARQAVDCVVVVAGRAVSLRRTFADVRSGELVAFVGSGGMVELALRDGSAAAKLRVTAGAEVRLRT